MIKGNNPVKIKEYTFIDHKGEGLGITRPKQNEVIVGYPYNYYSDNAYPFIEHIINGKVTQSVNPLDLAWIEFDID